MANFYYDGQNDNYTNDDFIHNDFSDSDNGYLGDDGGVEVPKSFLYILIIVSEAIAFLVGWLAVDIDAWFLAIILAIVVGLVGRLLLMSDNCFRNHKQATIFSLIAAIVVAVFMNIICASDSPPLFSDLILFIYAFCL